MPNETIDQLIARILADPRSHGSSAMAGRTFADEPILMRGSQMGRYVPERCRKMRELARSPEARSRPESWLFWRQGKLMEDYEDDAEYTGAFEQYFPTYQSMSDRQLRGYFTWRAHVRAGSVRPASLSFAFVYLYELLNGIGVEPGAEGFRAIERFWWEYRAIDPRVDRYARRWLLDYAAYHGLPRDMALPYAEADFDQALAALSDALARWPAARPRRARTKPDLTEGADQPGEEAMFGALDLLSTYRPRVSRLHRDRPDTLRHVCCAVLARLAGHYDARRKAGLVESLFGPTVAFPHVMFSSAVFWEPAPHPDATYEIDRLNRYSCKGGRWYWEGLHGAKARSPQLGAVLRACDQHLRDAIGYAHPLVRKQQPKYLERIIDEQVTARLAWEEDRESRRVRIDLSKLGGIRTAAAATREALLIDEERSDEPGAGPDMPAAAPRAAQPAQGAPAQAPRAAAPRAAQAGPRAPEAPVAVAHGDAQGLGLTAEEAAVLGRLLDDEPPAGALVSGTPLTMVVDGINERLFDLLGDTAVEFDGDEPRIIEDYREDVRRALRP